MPRAPSDLATATVLFTDVVDSTATRIRLGEDAADRLFARHSQLLRAVVRAHGVALIKGVGDGIMAVFESATAAFKAASAIEHAVYVENRRSTITVEIRSGLSSGDVIWTEDDVQGLPPIEATRLASAAQAAQILCSELSIRVANGRSGLEFKEIGALSLKGLEKPLQAYEVLWWQQAPGEEASLPLWLTRDDFLPFVGRGEEIAGLTHWLAQTSDTPRIAVISGEAGIGKTRLVAEVLDRTTDGEHLMLIGRCTELAERPYQPVAEAIERLATSQPAVLLQAELDSSVSDLVRIAPYLAEAPFSIPAPSIADPETEYFHLLAALSQLFARLSAISPVVLVLEDVHWITGASLRLLIAVLRRVRGAAMHVIVTMRDAPIDIGNDVAPQLRDLQRLPDLTRIALTPLAIQDIRSAVSVAAVDLSSDIGAIAERISEITGGNAFLVTETVRELRTGIGLQSIAVPETIALFVAGRVDRVGPVSRELIHLIACANRMEVSVLQRAADSSEASFLTSLEEALDTGLVWEDSEGLVGMAHELGRTAVQAGISPSRSGALHRRLLRALTAVHPNIATTHPYVVAGHLSAIARIGDDSDVKCAADAAAAAARHATTRLAHQEAVSWYQQCLRLQEKVDSDQSLRLELLLELGEAQWRAGSREARETLSEAGRLARTVGRHDVLIRAALAGNRGFFSLTANVETEAIDLLAAAIEVAEPEALATRAELLASLASELTWAPEGDRRFDLSDQALALARKSGDRGTIAKVLGMRNLTISAADTLEQRLADSAELLELAASTSDDLLRFHAVFQRTGPLLEIGDTSSITHLLKEARQLADSLGQPQLLWLVEFSRAGLALMLGELPVAEATAEQALRLGVAAGRRMEAAAFYSEQLAEIRRLQGRLSELIDGMRAASQHLLVDPVHAVLRYLCEFGEEDIGQLFDEAIGARGLPPRRDLAQRAALDNLILVATKIQRQKELPALYEALAPFADTFGHSAVAHPCGHHFLALLAWRMGQLTIAQDHFAAAAALHERARAPLLLAESLIDWMDLLAATGAARSEIERIRGRATDAMAGRSAPLFSDRLARSAGQNAR